MLKPKILPKSKNEIMIIVNEILTIQQIKKIKIDLEFAIEQYNKQDPENENFKNLKSLLSQQSRINIEKLQFESWRKDCMITANQFINTIKKDLNIKQKEIYELNIDHKNF